MDPKTPSKFWSIERVVAALTPVFSAVAGAATGAVGQLLPGVTLNQTDVTALFIAGSTAAAAAALKWLHGRQKYTQISGDIEHVIGEVASRVQRNVVAGPAIGDIERALVQQRDQIVQGVAQSLGASPKVEEIAQEVVQKLIGAQVPPTPPVAPAV